MKKKIINKDVVKKNILKKNLVKKNLLEIMIKEAKLIIGISILAILTIIIIILLIVLGSPSYKNTFIIHNSGELEVSQTGDGNWSYKRDDKIPDNIFNNSLIHVIGNMDLTYSSSITSVTNTSTVAKFKVNNDISISKISSAKIGNIIINSITNDEVKIHLSLTQFINRKDISFSCSKKVITNSTVNFTFNSLFLKFEYN